MTRNLAQRLSASIYEILDSYDSKTDAPADTTTKCTEWMPCTYIGNHWSCSQNKSNDRDVVPSCQIPWAIFQWICVKWNHTGLPEDVQNQQRGQRMRMMHIVMMNIIRSDTDDNKVFECAGFQSCLPCLSNVYIIYSLIQYNQPFHLCGLSFWHGFPLYRIHTNALLELSSAFKLWFDILHVSQNTSIHLLTFVESSICHLTQWSQSWRPFTWKLFITAIGVLITRIVLE